MDPSDLTRLLERRTELEGLLGRFEIWLLIFGVLVVIGVAGESFFGIRTWWNNRKLQQVSEQIDQYRQSQIAEALRKAAEANQIAEQERLARVKIQQQLADRTISGAQRDKLQAILKTRHGQHATVESLVSEGREALAYALKITAVFRDAGWNTTPPREQSFMTTPLSGILISTQQDAVSKELGDFVAQAFETANIPVTRYQENGNIAAGEVLVLIGGK